MFLNVARMIRETFSLIADLATSVNTGIAARRGCMSEAISGMKERSQKQ
jgi:hypothetical protein